MSEQKAIRDPKTNELRLSIEDLDVVSGGGTGEIVEGNGTTIIMTIIDNP